MFNEHIIDEYVLGLQISDEHFFDAPCGEQLAGSYLLTCEISSLLNDKAFENLLQRFEQQSDLG